jgi:hypothetical protein
MEEFIEYQRFPTFNDAEDFINLLEVNQIPYKVDDSATHYDLAATAVNPLEAGIIIQIRQTDKERVDKISSSNTQTTSLTDNYMYTLSDNDIIDAVVNPDEWTNEEHILAQEIFKQRNLKPTAETIKASRKEKIETEKKEQLKQQNLITGGASWFMWIGILSALNILAIIFNQNLQFVAGLGINYFILGIMEGIRRASGINLMPLGYALAFLVSGLFIIVWRISRKENKGIYLTGLIIYGLDTIIFLFTKEWFSLGFHLFALLMLYTGYDALRTRINET